MKPISAVIQGQDTAVVPRTASVVDAVRIMTARNIGAVPVVDDERLVGIFTERDVMARVVAVGLDPKNTEVGDVMSPDLVTAAPACFRFAIYWRSTRTKRTKRSTS
jgi:CBS domain-containing protein